jgi:predicted oxidoreductase (fatty acid repression mutant protein)
LSPKDAPGLVTAASKNDIKDIIKNMTDRFTGPKENRVILGERNTRLWNTYLDKLAKTLSKEDYEAMKQLVTIKRQRKKSGGMVERNYYDYAPRNI